MGYYLREIEPKDVDLIYKWANDPTVRANAFNTEQIPYDTHRMWFAKMLADRDILKYILCDDSRKEAPEIGQIRLAIEGEKAVISYIIDGSMRGKGLGTRMVLMAEEKARDMRPDVIYCVGQVKHDNIASSRVFEKCGYDEQYFEKYMEYTKRIRS